MVDEAFMQAIADSAVEEERYKTKYEQEADAWWEALTYDDKLRAFYSVVKRIYEGDVKDQGSYRYVLYDVFGFEADAYALGMDCGYMSLHNAIKTEEEEQILADYRVNKGQNNNV